MQNVKIGLVQTASSNKKKENLTKLEHFITNGAEKGAKIISLQELANTNYIAQTQDIDNFLLAEEADGNSVKWAASIAKKLKIYLIFPYFEKDETSYFNSAIIINPDGKTIGKYRKNHIPQNTNYQEKYYFRPGNLGYPVIETEYGKIGISICWDHWFPEVQRIYGLKGADIVFSPTANGFSNSNECLMDKGYKHTWKKMLIGQAITGGFYFAIINKVGKEGVIDFFGSSFVISPRGETIGSLSENEENVLVCDIDLDEARDWKRHQQFARDRRISTYNDLM